MSALFAQTPNPFVASGCSFVSPESPEVVPKSLLQSQPYVLSEQERTFFEMFGFLRIQGLFAADIVQITTVFEDILARAIDEEQVWEVKSDLHGDNRRITVPFVIEQDPWLTELSADPRLLGAIEGLMGPNYQYGTSDGNLMFCDTTWHPDTYGSPLTEFHVKACLYLDPIDRDSGALRVMPGSNFWNESFATKIRGLMRNSDEIETVFGVDGPDIPCHVIDSEPGDLLLWNYRTMHASFHGHNRRRFISLGYSENTAADDAPPTNGASSQHRSSTP